LEKGRSSGCALAHFNAREFPLRDRHLLEQELFGTVLRLPVGFQVGTELVILLRFSPGSKMLRVRKP